MAKYLVEGTIRVKIEVEADSEDDAIEVANEEFDFDKHVSKDSEPEFDTANLLGSEDEDEDEVYARSSRSSYDEDGED